MGGGGTSTSCGSAEANSGHGEGRGTTMLTALSARVRPSWTACVVQYVDMSIPTAGLCAAVAAATADSTAGLSGASGPRAAGASAGLKLASDGINEDEDHDIDLPGGHEKVGGALGQR